MDTWADAELGVVVLSMAVAAPTTIDFESLENNRTINFVDGLGGLPFGTPFINQSFESFQIDGFLLTSGLRRAAQRVGVCLELLPVEQHERRVFPRGGDDRAC